MIADGLPEPLPRGERLLWQGRPRWQTLAVRAFHVRKLALYGLILAAWRMVAGVHDGQGVVEAAIGTLPLVPFTLLAVGIPAGLAWLYGRSTVYTITDRRVVIRSGVALSLSLNLPFRVIGSASLRVLPDGTGDLPLALAGRERIGFIYLWPNVRPWRLARPEPMLRAVPEPRRVADILARALTESDRPAVPEPRQRPLVPAAA